MAHNLTLLYVEDDDIIRENFAEIFSNYFTTILLASNGNDALDIYKSKHLDLIILDILIPGMNGLDVTTTIREKDKNIEIILLSAHSQREKLIQAINTQVFSYLIKPVMHEELHKTLTQSIQKIQFKNMINLGNDYTYNMKDGLLFYQGKEVNITKNETRLVSYLSQYPHKHHSASDIAKVVLKNKSQDIDVASNNVIQLISRFKKKIISTCNNEHFFIDNIYGLGYKITLN